MMKGARRKIDWIEVLFWLCIVFSILGTILMTILANSGTSIYVHIF